MLAVWYERKGPAREVLQFGERPLPQPAPGEVRVKVHVSAVNPSDTKNRGGARGNLVMPFPVVIPHQDGAGVIDAVGDGVDPQRIGQRVWIYEAHFGRAAGTAAPRDWRARPSAAMVRALSTLHQDLLEPRSP